MEQGDMFEYYSQFEKITNFKSGTRETITLARAEKKLLNSNCCKIEALSPDKIKYNCAICGKEYIKTKTEIMHKNFSECPICKRKLAIQKAHNSRMRREYLEMVKAANEQNITVLSKEIVIAKEGIKCQKPNGSTFVITYQQFKKRRGILDPDYKKGGTSIPEAVCRIIIEQLTGKKFPKGYPKGWTYVTNQGLDKTFSVDMYNCTDFDTPIAFEYWGKEIHVTAKKSSTKYGLEKVRRTQENDKKKLEYAKKTNTKLIILQGYDNYISIPRLTENIKDILRKNEIPFNDEVIPKVTTDQLYNGDYLQKVKKHCENHKPFGGTLKSDLIINVNSKIEILCNKHNKEFRTSPLKLLYSNHWNCPDCITEGKRDRLKLNPEKIAKRLATINYPYKISFIRFLQEPSSHAISEWNCEVHGNFEKRMDSVLYKSHGRFHACPECEIIMYPWKKK